MKNELYFLIRHTPFWGMPLLFISLEFGYIFWLRKKKLYLKISALFSFIAFAALVFYFWAGGPEKSVKIFIQLSQKYF